MCWRVAQPLSTVAARRCHLVAPRMAETAAMLSWPRLLPQAVHPAAFLLCRVTVMILGAWWLALVRACVPAAWPSVPARRLPGAGRHFPCTLAAPPARLVAVCPCKLAWVRMAVLCELLVVSAPVKLADPCSLLLAKMARALALRSLSQAPALRWPAPRVSMPATGSTGVMLTSQAVLARKVSVGDLSP